MPQKSWTLSGLSRHHLHGASDRGTVGRFLSRQRPLGEREGLSIVAPSRNSSGYAGRRACSVGQVRGSRPLVGPPFRIERGLARASKVVLSLRERKFCVPASAERRRLFSRNRRPACTEVRNERTVIRPSLLRRIRAVRGIGRFRIPKAPALAATRKVPCWRRAGDSPGVDTSRCPHCRPGDGCIGVCALEIRFQLVLAKTSATVLPETTRLVSHSDGGDGFNLWRHRRESPSGRAHPEPPAADHTRSRRHQLADFPGQRRCHPVGVGSRK